MVAMLETRDAATLFIGEIDPASLPLTVVLLDPRQDPEKPAVYSKVRLLPAAEPLGDPTWEDAAWQ